MQKQQSVIKAIIFAGFKFVVWLKYISINSKTIYIAKCYIHDCNSQLTSIKLFKIDR